MSEPVIQSAGLAFKTAYTVAAIRLGYVSHQHKQDMTHPDVVLAQRNYEDADEKLTRWILAAERILETEERLLVGGPRSPRPENVKVIPEDASTVSGCVGTKRPQPRA